MLTHTSTGYNELATMTIKKTNAVTQSVANTAKRVIVIVGVAIVLGTLAAFSFLYPAPKPAHMRSRIRMWCALLSPCSVGTWGARRTAREYRRGCGRTHDASIRARTCACICMSESLDPDKISPKPSFRHT